MGISPNRNKRLQEKIPRNGLRPPFVAIFGLRCPGKDLRKNLKKGLAFFKDKDYYIDNFNSRGKSPVRI